jgi:cytochrome c-type biogenesis protein CcmH
MSAMMQRLIKGLQALVLAVALVLVVSRAALAVEPDEMLPDPAQEARARAISQGLRCLVCQNESIDDSGASLAHDIRVLVRERIKAGDTDQQVIDYMVARYGEFVLLKPPLSWHTVALWGLPPTLLLIGIGAMLIMARRRSVVPATGTLTPGTLTPDEEARVEDLLRREGLP